MLARLLRALDPAAERSNAHELMDDVSIQGERLERTLDELERLNRNLGAYRPSELGLESLLPPWTAKISVLDVGAGGADVARRLVDWGKARRLEVSVRGIDLTDTTIEYARRKSADYPSIQIERQDLFALPDEPSFDVVHAAQVLHHFPGESAAKALRKMFALARFGVVVNDLHRHVLPWVGIKLITRAFSNSDLVQNDGPVSVLRAFTRADWQSLAREADLPPPEIVWHLPFRWGVVYRR